MAFKTFYCVLSLFFITFTVVKGSCLEYGHSCWGAHGKRSGNNKIFHGDAKPATEVDFADLNAIKESNYDSTEDRDKPHSNDLAPPTSNMARDEDLARVENQDKMLKLKSLLLKQLSKNGKHRVADDADVTKTQDSNGEAMLSERWRRLPIYNLRRLHLANDNWLSDLEREQPRVVDVSEDYM